MATLPIPVGSGVGANPVYNSGSISSGAPTGYTGSTGDTYGAGGNGGGASS